MNGLLLNQTNVLTADNILTTLNIDKAYTTAELINLIGANNAASATTLSASNSIRTNLASNTAVTIKGNTVITPGCYGILPASKGGTGTSTIDKTVTSGSSNVVTSGAVYNFLNTDNFLLTQEAARGMVGARTMVLEINSITYSLGSGCYNITIDATSDIGLDDDYIDTLSTYLAFEITDPTGGAVEKQLEAMAEVFYDNAGITEHNWRMAIDYDYWFDVLVDINSTGTTGTSPSASTFYDYFTYGYIQNLSSSPTILFSNASTTDALSLSGSDLQEYISNILLDYVNQLKNNGYISD